MKPLLLFLLFLALTEITTAQNRIPNTQMPDGKNRFRLENVDVRTPILRPGSAKVITPGLYLLEQDRMPCIVPDTNDLVAIPNAFPEFKLPKVGAIPNPSPKINMDKLKSFNSPGSK